MAHLATWRFILVADDLGVELGPRLGGSVGILRGDGRVPQRQHNYGKSWVIPAYRTCYQNRYSEVK